MGPLRQIPGARRGPPGQRPAQPYAGGATRAPTAPRPPDCSAGRPGSAVLHFLELAKHGQGVAPMGQLRMGLGEQERVAAPDLMTQIELALMSFLMKPGVVWDPKRLARESERWSRRLR